MSFEGKGLIVGRHAGKDLPDPFLKVITDRASCAGCAVPDEGGNFMELKHEASAISPDAIKSIITDFKDKAVLFHFLEHPGVVEENNIQPFPVIHETFNFTQEDKQIVQAAMPVIVMAMDGDFSKWAEVNSPYSPEYLAFSKYLQPKLEQIYNQANGDIKHFFELLEGSITKTELLNTISTGGIITLYAHDGTLKSFAQSMPVIDYDFGWISRQTAYKEGSFPATVVKAVTNTIARIPRASMSGKPAATPAAAPAVAPTAAVTAPKPVASTTPLKTMITCPKHVVGKNRRNYYQQNAGWVPPEWNDCPTVECRLVKDGISPQMAAVAAKPGPMASSADQLTTDVLPVMSPKVHEAILTDFIDSLKKDKSRIISPSEVQSQEGKHPSYTQKMGLKDGLDGVDSWSYEAHLYQAQKYPDGAAMLLHEYRCDRIKMKAAISRLTDTCTTLRAEIAEQMKNIEELTKPADTVVAAPAPATSTISRVPRKAAG